MLKIALKQYMNERHLSIQDVTDMTGISRPTVSQLASGKAKGIQFETLSKLANGLDADISELFDNQFSFETIKYYVEPIQFESTSSDESATNNIDNSELLNEYDPTIRVGFYYDSNVSDLGTVIEFKIPTRVAISNKIIGENYVYEISWNYDDLGEDSMESYNEQKLYDFLSSSPINFLEKIIGSISRDIIQMLESTKSKDFTPANYITFSADLPIHRLPNESLNFLWDKQTLLNKKLFDKLIDLKF